MDNKPEWWPETPYLTDIFPMTTEQYMEAVPNPTLRTAISGCMAGFGWQVAEKQFHKIFDELFKDRVDVREIVQALTDSNALLEDLQRAYEILPDNYSGNRKMVCDDARVAYDMGGIPYDRNTAE